MGFCLCEYVSSWPCLYLYMLFPTLTAEAPIPGKGTTFALISCLRVQGKLFRLTHQRRLECETKPDYNKRPPSRIGRFASQLRAALFCVSLSGGDDS